MDSNSPQHESPPREGDFVEMPSPTVAPLVLSLGLILTAAGAVMSLAFLVIGGGLCLIGLVMWVENLLPGRGHFHEPFVAPELRAKPVVAQTGAVDQLHEGSPGYRFRLPEHMHPISAGVKGGIFGGLIMPLPALAYGVLSGHGIWYPVNLLAAMVVPGMDHPTAMQLDQFSLVLTAVAVVIHVVMAISIGTIYGVLMPMLPEIPKPLAWGALLAPMVWTGVSYALMAAVNPVLQHGVDWFWFIASQFIFGVALASVMLLAHHWHPVKAGLLGGVCGCLVMPFPAILWGYFSGRGIWFPVNLLAGMVIHGMDQLPLEQLSQFRLDWLLAATGIHIVMGLTFGLMLGLLLPRLPGIPAPLAWGAMLLPLVWTAMSYSMMGVVNPLLAHRVDWPWFIVSQIIFGLAASIVVVRSEWVDIAPKGHGQAKGPETIDPQNAGTS